MNERQRSLRSASSEAPSIVLSLPELTPTPERITNGSQDCSVDIKVGDADYYRVSTHVLEEVPWFRKFLSRNWKQTRYHLPEDHPLAVRIVFLILHHQPSRIPVSMLSSDLFHLATLCDKYDITDIVVPHVENHRWIENLWDHGKPCGRDWQSWVWILGGLYHTEERCRKLSTVLDVIAANIRVEDDEWIFEWNDKVCHVSEIEHPQQTIKDINCKSTAPI